MVTTWPTAHRRDTRARRTWNSYYDDAHNGCSDSGHTYYTIMLVTPVRIYSPLGAPRARKPFHYSYTPHVVRCGYTNTDTYWGYTDTY